MRSLFIPDARLIPASAGKDGHSDAVFLTIDAYIARSSGRMTNDGFFEHSIHDEMEQFGNIVQIWSTYESRHDPKEERPFARGINSFQLLKDGDRYSGREYLLGFGETGKADSGAVSAIKISEQVEVRFCRGFREKRV